MKLIKIVLGLVILFLIATPVLASQQNHEEIRKAAQQAYREGNWKDAYAQYRRLCLEINNDPKMMGPDFTQVWQCLRQLGRLNELDKFREDVIAQHRNNWRLLQAAARSYIQNNHWGYMIAGEFHRGGHRGGGKYVNAIQRDRVRALQIMQQAMVLAENDSAKSEVAYFYLEFARIYSHYRGYPQAWRLQYLTDLSQLPDYEPGYGYEYSQRQQGAPVDDYGQPVFHHLPQSFDKAESDGERWRYLLNIATQVDSRLENQVKYEFAAFLHQQFGVQTLSSDGAYFIGRRAVRDDDLKSDQSGPYDVHTLADTETIAKLSTGVRRFQLPQEFAYINVLREIIRKPDSGYVNDATRLLAQIYENRRQYDRAVDFWQLYKTYHRSEAQNRIDQIVKNWGVFEPAASQPAGSHPSVEYRFRNATQVNFKAYRVRVNDLLQQVKAYIRSNPGQLDWNNINLNNIGYRLIHENQTHYIGKKVTEWQMDLKPAARHWDKRITVSLPNGLEQPGAYLLVAELNNGNIARIIIWVSDTVIIKRPLNNQVLYYVADAVSGKALPDATVDFIGYRTQRIGKTKRYRVIHSSFTRKTNTDGLIILGPDEMKNDLRWLATVTTGEGRLAFLGFSNVWYPNYYDNEYNQTKTIFMTDRPVYRPGQNVQFKAWVRHAKYDQEDVSGFGGQSFTVRIRNPNNEEIYTKTIRADEYGGLNGEYELPSDATLGVYHITHGSGIVYGGHTFRVEEYKKPEFEVTVEAPTEPVMLGEKITALIKANYYFGSPVTEATVNYKVLRTEHDGRWYPPFYWDWFYGPGYWWYAYDYPWYPGWHDWGTKRPIWTWWPHWPQKPPEVVAEGEVKIGAGGTTKITIDTELAKLIHGDTDHSYTISAEVRDLSRRTIVGQGEVLVARKPFTVHAWVDRGYYRVGDTILASFKAQTLDQKPVQGTGILKLLRITYADNKPLEAEVQQWSLGTDANGQASLQIQASSAGQYRLSYTVTDNKNHSIEGGYIFTVRGKGDDGSQYRFAKIELITDKREYKPGETVRLQINTDRNGAAVVLFVRPTNGVYLAPKIIHLTGKSALEEITITQKDMPNLFVEAFTVYDAKVHSELREIVVPPAKRMLNVKVIPSEIAYRPGQKAKLKIELTDYVGEPFKGTAAISVYDRSVEYISGGSNVPEIRSFFWKWRRSHHPHKESSLGRWSYNLLKKGETPMRNIGVFGYLAETPEEDTLDKNGAVKAKEETEFRDASRSELKPAPAEAEEVAGEPRALQKAISPGIGAKKDEAGKFPSSATQNLVQPTVRTRFADTAFWAATVNTDDRGTAEVEFTMPENLTGWKVKVWAMGHGTKTGEGSAEVVTRKDLILRLQAPRFFVETDEVVLSANLHNYLNRQKLAQVQLEIEGSCLALMTGLQAEQSVRIDANGEQRVDWRVAVVKEGEALVRMKALTDEESDAMEMRFPVYVHGFAKQIPKSGVIRPDQTRASLSFTVPAARRVEESRLQLRYSPTLAGAMVDALPYLTSYPYGCTEQTLNRFLPTVITQHTLKQMGLDLKAIKDKLSNLNSQEIGDDRQRATRWKRYDHLPVFDEEIVADMVSAGVKQLADMQLSDGGWGWFSGYGERAYPHTTALVVHGLQIAQALDVTLPEGMLEAGIRWLQNYQAHELARLKLWDQEKKNGKSHADNLDALVYMVLVDANREQEKMRAYLYRDRNHLAVYAKAMFGMALHRIGDTEKLAMIMKNIDQYLIEDDENQTAYLNLPNSSYWWYWYGSEYEAHGYYLKLLSRTEPGSQKASRLVKYLLNNRKHSTYWNSTRDTAVIVEAFADYLATSGEDRPDLTVDVYFDGKKMKTVRITSENLFTFDNRFILEGNAITTGMHTMQIVKSGRGSVYFNAYLDYFTLEDFITRAGLEIKVQRKVYRLKKVDKKIKDVGSQGQVVDRKVEKYEREVLENLASAHSGDLVEVELEIESKNDYEYLVFEDLKAAGFEPVEVRSGYNGNDLMAYVEYRDRKVCFFVHRLARGRHSVSYRLQAEIPGKFSALPTRAYAMYAPELKANSDEIKLIVLDK
ncbi:MAG: hypothetical protein JSV83_05140 [Desulfobacterales bacterium]|nr:MAG: hypothetical protein JSV83_05140 [Desulfobacterales bacterium]